MESDNSTTEVISQVTISFVLSVIFVFFFHLLTSNLIKFEPDKQVFMVINIVMVALFISVFYFTGGVKIEEKVLEEQLDYIIGDFMHGANVIVPDEILNGVILSINETDVTNKELDKKVEVYNAALVKKALLTIGTLVVVAGIYVTAMTKNNNIDILPILGQSAVILVFIALTEILFMKYVGGNYYSGDPNMVKMVALKALEKVPVYKQ